MSTKFYWPNEKKPKFKFHDLVRTADFKNTLADLKKGYTTNWSYNLHEITETVNDTTPGLLCHNLPERYNQALLKKTELSMKENKDVMTALNLN